MWQSFSSVSAIRFEGQLEVLPELVVRCHVVARHAEHHCPRLHEVLVAVAELHRLGGAAGGIVLGVEIQDDGLPEIGLRRELHAAGCERFKFREGFVEGWRHEGISELSRAWRSQQLYGLAGSRRLAAPMATCSASSSSAATTSGLRRPARCRYGRPRRCPWSRRRCAARSALAAAPARRSAAAAPLPKITSSGASAQQLLEVLGAQPSKPSHGQAQHLPRQGTSTLSRVAAAR